MERFPSLFGNNKFLEEYPYFLPCAVPATFSVVTWLVTFFFLKEVCDSSNRLSVRGVDDRGLQIDSPFAETGSGVPLWRQAADQFGGRASPGRWS